MVEVLESMVVGGRQEEELNCWTTSRRGYYKMKRLLEDREG